MDMEGLNNSVRLCGVMAGRPEYSHNAGGEEFYIFPLEVMRLSGNCDTVNIVLRRNMLETVDVQTEKLMIEGELRSYNNRSGSGAKLVITVLAKTVSASSEEDCNRVHITGTICKPPKLRETPLGRDICDLMVAVNRNYGRSDYLPCICWGAKAREAAGWEIGNRLTLEGRIQSRHYLKLMGDTVEERTAFEVSASEAELVV